MAYSLGSVSSLKIDLFNKILSEEKELILKSLGEK